VSLFAAFYTYGHLLTVAFSLTMALAFAVSALRVPNMKDDFWNAATYTATMLAGIVEMWLALEPSALGARTYFSVVALLYMIVTVGFHAQYAKLALPPDRQRAYHLGVLGYALWGALLIVGFYTGVLDGGVMRTPSVWGVHTMVIGAPWWSALIIFSFTLGNIALNFELLLRAGPHLAERRVVAVPMLLAPVVVVYELLICVGVNPYLPIGGYFAAMVGLSGIFLLAERVRRLAKSGPVVGGYVIDARLGGGGMADVFLAHREGAGELKGVVHRVAVKRLRPEYAADPAFVRMFLDEARLVARLSHPNIVTLHDVGRDQGELYLAMELIEGATLSEIMRVVRAGQGTFTTAVAIEIGVQLCDALDYAHTLKDEGGRPLELVHRDVSPQNVLVDEAGHVKLADFGIARSVDRSAETATGVLKGKLSYMAPEQIRGERYDHRVDLYAVGILLFEIVTGTRPYDSKSDATLLFEILKGKPAQLDRLDAISTPLAQVVKWALAVDASLRPATGAALRDALMPLRDERAARAALVQLVVAARLLAAQRRLLHEPDTLADGREAPTRLN
jgi:hypothetical protein